MSYPILRSTTKDDNHVFPDEDESKYHYTELPAEERIPANFLPETVLGNPRTFTLPDGSKIDVDFRRYVEGEDDEAFQKLDSECRQGKSGLETVFFLKEKWASFQKDGECIVAHPAGNPRDIVATARGFRKWVFLNGIRVPATYQYLLRVSPRFRSCGLGEFTARVLLNFDYFKGCRYILGYVVEDNEKSLALQRRVINGREDSLQTEFKKWYVSGYTPADLIKKLSAAQIDASQHEIYRSDNVREQVEHTRAAFAKAQLLPCDLSNIFRSKLSEGTYFLREKATGAALASFSIWNSGAIRSSRLPGMKDFLETPCIFYNVWTNPSYPQQKTTDALSALFKIVSEEILRTKEHGFIYVFLLDDHPLAQSFKDTAKFFVGWKARLWYWDCTFKHDPSTGCDLVFDPRDALQ